MRDNRKEIRREGKKKGGKIDDFKSLVGVTVDNTTHFFYLNSFSVMNIEIPKMNMYSELIKV